MSCLTGVSLAILFSHHRECEDASPAHQELYFARAFFARNQFVTRRVDLTQDNSIQGHAVGIYDRDKNQMIAQYTTLVLIWSQDTLFYNLKVHCWHRRVGRW